jgi:8-oxo-dGTP diphosphatase
MEEQEKYKYKYEYPRPAVAVDCVIFGFDEGELKVLLIERSTKTFRGEWALPGGFIEEKETAEECVERILQKETCLSNIYMEQLYTFSDIHRDPRFRVISVAYYGLVKLSNYNAQAGTHTSNVNWCSISDVPHLAFDHAQILEVAKERLKEKIKYQPIGFELLPEKFTIPDLLHLYKTVLQTELDDRNFRKKILSYDLLIDTGEQQRGARNRAPKLYRFDKDRYEELTKTGFYFEL